MSLLCMYLVLTSKEDAGNQEYFWSRLSTLNLYSHSLPQAQHWNKMSRLGLCISGDERLASGMRGRGCGVEEQAYL